jgi:hypothetical protein
MFKMRRTVVKTGVPRLLRCLPVVTAMAFVPLAASAQDTPMMGGGMKGEDIMKGCDMMAAAQSTCSI